MSRTFVIAEAASAHDGSLDKAYRLIHAASDAGADACKFQLWTSADRLAQRRRAPDYRAVYSRYQVPVTWLPRLRDRCEARGIDFLCTTFLPEDLAVVAPFVERFKVSSFESFDRQFLIAHLGYCKPIIASIGMTAPTATVLNFPTVSWLHCVSAYPAPFNEMNLAVLRSGWCSGLSDHSGLVETGAFAVCAGARILEVHLKLPDTDPQNPDAGEFALLPESLSDYVELVRQAEAMLGDGVKRKMPCEAPMAAYRVTA